MYNLKEVRDPQRSPDGKWVAYTVARAIKDTDKNDTRRLDGELGRPEDPGDLVSRERVAAALEPRRQVPGVPLVAPGCQGRADLADEPRRRRSRQTDRRQRRRLRLRVVARQQAFRPRGRAIPIRAIRRRRRGEEGRSKPKTPKPIVIDRYHFKADVSGYLRGERSHLQLFDIASKKAEPLTPGSVRRGVARRGRPTARRSRSSARHGDRIARRNTTSS